MRWESTRDIAYTVTAFAGANVLSPLFAVEISSSLATVLAATVSGLFVLLARSLEARVNSRWRERALELEREVAELRAALRDLNPYGFNPYDTMEGR